MIVGTLGIIIAFLGIAVLSSWPIKKTTPTTASSPAVHKAAPASANRRTEKTAVKHVAPSPQPTQSVLDVPVVINNYNIQKEEPPAPVPAASPVPPAPTPAPVTINNYNIQGTAPVIDTTKPVPPVAYREPPGFVWTPGHEEWIWEPGHGWFRRWVAHPLPQ